MPPHGLECTGGERDKAGPREPDRRSRAIRADPRTRAATMRFRRPWAWRLWQRGWATGCKHSPPAQAVGTANHRNAKSRGSPDRQLERGKRLQPGRNDHAGYGDRHWIPACPTSRRLFEIGTRQTRLPDDRHQRADAELLMVGNRSCDRCVAIVLLHHHMAAATTHFPETVLEEDSAYLGARERPELSGATLTFRSRNVSPPH